MYTVYCNYIYIRYAYMYYYCNCVGWNINIELNKQIQTTHSQSHVPKSILKWIF